jgi:hypothetical protein
MTPRIWNYGVRIRIINAPQSYRQSASTIGSPFEIPSRRANGRKINKYTAHGVNAAAVQYSTRVRSIRPIDWQLALTQPDGKYSSKSGTSGDCNSRAV